MSCLFTHGFWRNNDTRVVIRSQSTYNAVSQRNNFLGLTSICVARVPLTTRVSLIVNIQHIPKASYSMGRTRVSFPVRTTTPMCALAPINDTRVVIYRPRSPVICAWPPCASLLSFRDPIHWLIALPDINDTRVVNVFGA